MSDAFPPEAKWEYETVIIPYEVRHQCRYRPDFVFPEQCFFLEGKGYFSKEDRDKILMVIEQHPGLDVRIVFYSNDKVTKTMTYGQWCDKHGVPWSVGTMPPSWLRHKPNAQQKRAFHEFFAT